MQKQYDEKCEQFESSKKFIKLQKLTLASEKLSKASANGVNDLDATSYEDNQAVTAIENRPHCKRGDEARMSHSAVNVPIQVTNNVSTN